MDHLFITYCGLRLRVPVYHPVSAIYQPLFIAPDKTINNSFVQILFQSKPCSLPVAGSPQFLKLIEYDSTKLVRPLTDLFKKHFPSQFIFFISFLTQSLHHLRFSSDRCVICTWYPARVVALHPCTAYKDILDCIVQHMAHMQDPGYIGRGDDNGEGLTRIRFRLEVVMFFPIFVPFVFDC